MKELFVGNLAFSVTEDQLKEHFEQYGTLTKVKLITDRNTGRSKGSAFVEFEKAKAAKTASENENGN